MITANERESLFSEDLDQLLEKHKAFVRMSYRRNGHDMIFGIATVYMYGEYDEDGNILAEYTEFDLS